MTAQHLLGQHLLGQRLLGRRLLGLSWWALLAALLLHLVVAIALWGDLIPLPNLSKHTVAVELVSEAHAPPPPRRAFPPQPPAIPPASPKPAPPPPQSSPATPKPAPPLPMPPKLQLHPGRLAKKSAEAGGAGVGIGVGAGGEGPAEGVTEATQSERDYFLAQVLPLWRRPPGLTVGPDTVVRLRVLVLADGTLGPPLSAKTPWDPSRAIIDYAAMSPADPWRQALEGLYLALRMAQPLKLPPELAARAPLGAVLDFRPADLP